MRRPTHATLALLLALGPMRAHAEPTHAYCYAPDPASGTVHVSSIVPVGAIHERGRLGAEFVQHLRKTGRLQGEVVAYCVMRDGVDVIARARAVLALERCDECGGLTRFTDVAWSRGGVTIPTPSLAPRVNSELTPPATPTPIRAAPVPDTPPTNDLRKLAVVVLGNTETGKLLVVRGEPDLERVAQAQARSVRATGWRELVASRDTGYGAAMCVKENGAMRFFAVHGKDSLREAIREARAKAEAYAAPRKATVKLCGSPWSSAPVAPLERETGVIDTIKDAVRQTVTCDPATLPAGQSCSPPPRYDAIGKRG